MVPCYRPWRSVLRLHCAKTNYAGRPNPAPSIFSLRLLPEAVEQVDAHVVEGARQIEERPRIRDQSGAVGRSPVDPVVEAEPKVHRLVGRGLAEPLATLVRHDHAVDGAVGALAGEHVDVDAPLRERRVERRKEVLVVRTTPYATPKPPGPYLGVEVCVFCEASLPTIVKVHLSPTRCAYHLLVVHITLYFRVQTNEQVGTDTCKYPDEF